MTLPACLVATATSVASMRPLPLTNPSPGPWVFQGAQYTSPAASTASSTTAAAKVLSFLFMLPPCGLHRTPLGQCARTRIG